jgi:septin 7
VAAQLASEKIAVFEFPDTEDSPDTHVALNKTLRATMPFAVIGSEAVHDMSGKKVRGRRYPWGIVEGAYHAPCTRAPRPGGSRGRGRAVDNPAHCDFVKLRDVLIK